MDTFMSSDQNMERVLRDLQLPVDVHLCFMHKIYNNN